MKGVRYRTKSSSSLLRARGAFGSSVYHTSFEHMLSMYANKYIYTWYLVLSALQSLELHVGVDLVCYIHSGRQAFSGFSRSRRS